MDTSASKQALSVYCSYTPYAMHDDNNGWLNQHNDSVI